jgi:hypothetical protein
MSISFLTSPCFSAQDDYKNKSKISLESSGSMKTINLLAIRSRAEKDAWRSKNTYSQATVSYCQFLPL